MYGRGETTQCQAFEMILNTLKGDRNPRSKNKMIVADHGRQKLLPSNSHSGDEDLSIIHLGM